MARGATKIKNAMGTYVALPSGTRAFVPAALPRTLTLSAETVRLLDAATRSAAMLGGIGETLPNPHLLIRPFISREAVLSSRIEGTRTLMSDLYLYEVSNTRNDPQGDALEVANYVRALEFGLAALTRLPLSVRLFNQVHAQLLGGVRGEDKRPGELRKKQVYVGVSGDIRDALFVPPPPALVRDLLADLEKFIHATPELPVLVQCAMIHFQFETIHPYLDGNGRLGRLLITLFLCERGLLTQPLLYLSAYLEKHRAEYYDQLTGLRVSGDWDRWLQFVLLGVREQADDAILRSRRVLELHRSYVGRLRQGRISSNSLALLDHLFENPYVTTPAAARMLGITQAAARALIDRLRQAGIVEATPGGRPAVYVANELLAAIEGPVVEAPKPRLRRRLELGRLW